MKYSIVIPMYNTEEYLDKCIKSVLAQKCSNYELLLIDDGSTDKTGQIAGLYACQYDFIHCYHFENAGSVEARRRGSRIAKGEYIVYIDSDDFISEDYLSTIDAAIEENKYPDMIVLSFSRADIDGNLNGKIIHNNVSEGIYADAQKELIIDNYIYDRSLPGMNYGSIHFSVCTKVIKRKLYLKCQEKIDDRISFGDDMVATGFILKDDECKKIVVLNYAGYIYRDNAFSMTNNVSIRSLEKYEYALIELCRIFNGCNNRICVHALRALSGILSVISNESNSYYEFHEKVKESYKYETIWGFARKAIVYKPSIKDLLKVFSIRYKFCRLFYYSSRINKGRIIK